MSTTQRTHTKVDAIADAHLATYCELNPFAATSIGIKGYDHLVTDLSPTGLRALHELNLRTLSQLQDAPIADEVDKVTVAAMRERLGLEVEMFESGWVFADLNNIASPLQALRDVFDIAPTATWEDWDAIAQRMSLLPVAAHGYIDSLKHGVSLGKIPALLQVNEGIGQAREIADPNTSFFKAFINSPQALEVIATAPQPEQLTEHLARGADAAIEAHTLVANYLEEELKSVAPTKDAAGRERYELASRAFLGARIDLDETYEWGLAALWPRHQR